ncbi:site-specific integrase [Geomonas ferrireducens]|uniref:site-specific integrase n=1 Tax=Geomonas ferrireducens TaxID=2570227 RepID=UPI0010A93657|nr:site-specific integrase [Geomonas ferrireducens]
MSFFTAGLVKRGTMYYIRVRVPDDLRRYISSREIKQSLRTARYCEAVKLARAWRTALDHFFGDLRRAQLTDNEIFQLRDKYLHETTESHQRALAAEKFSEKHAAWMIRQYELLIEIDRKALRTHDYSLIEQAVDRFLNKQNIVIDKDSTDYPYLCKEFLKARIIAFETKINRAHGNFTLTPAASSPPVDPSAVTMVEPLASDSSPTQDIGQQLSEIKTFLSKHKGSGGMFSVVAGKYIKSKETEEAWTDGTEDAMMETYDLFKEVIDDKDMNEYDNDDFLKFKELLTRLPKNRNKNPIFRTMSISEMLQIPIEEADKFSRETRDKHLRRISQLFAWAKVRKIISENYAAGIVGKNRRNRKDSRKPYDVEDLQKIVRTMKAKQAIPTQFWIPLFGLYTGMRADEICQLYLDDIYQIGAILCIDCTARRPDQSLKNEQSSRKIPVHPFLLELGFMNYHQSIMDAGHERLWPNLKMRVAKEGKGKKVGSARTKPATAVGTPQRGKGGYGAGWSNWYNEHFNRKFITEDPEKVFHSFRHNLSNALEKIPSVKSSTANMITGHAGENERERTYLEADIEMMYAALAQVQYPIDLDLLRAKSLWNKEGMAVLPKAPRVKVFRPASPEKKARRKDSVPVAGAAKRAK